MEPVAHAGCILKVDVQCDSCKLNVLEVLSSISGVYSVSIDAEEGVARVSGEVDPNRLLTALARSGRHAEVKTVNLRHPLLNRVSSGYGSSSYDHGCGYGYNDRYNGYGYGAIHDPYMYAGRRGLPEYSMGGGYEPHHHGSYHSNVSYPIRGYGSHAAANPFYDVSSYQRYAAQALFSPFRYGHYNYC